jgi:hypothetical protein
MREFFFAASWSSPILVVTTSLGMWSVTPIVFRKLKMQRENDGIGGEKELRTT